VAVPAAAELGERPVWDAAAGGLIWVDILAGHLHRYRPGAGDEVFHAAGVPVGAAAARAGGGYVLAAADGFRLVGADGGPDGAPLRPPGMTGDLRFNDGSCDPAGRFWGGTVARDRRPGAAALYRLDPGGGIVTVLEGVTESNGLGWSPDGGTFYYIDSGEPRPRIRAFPCDLAAGTLGSPRDLVQPPPEQGIPDGLIVDADGCLWVAFWGGHAVRRYSPRGELLAELAVPASQPSCPGFGGPDLDDLYLTTAWEDMTQAQRAADPLAGHLLRTRVEGAAGQPAGQFGG
jgi:sugar lactone lactonase YvrE